ncbi:MAG: NUDIX domain-containing protein [Fimbriimonas sp.]
MQKVREIARRRLFEGFLSVDEVELAVEGEEKPQRRQVLERGDAVGVLVYHRERNEILLVRQLRAPVLRHGEAWIDEIVAGMVDPGESPEEAAIREMEEEVGFRPRELRPLGSIYGSPGGTSERIWIFYAEISDSDRKGEGGGIEDERVDARWSTPAEAYRRLDGDELRDAKTQVALLRMQGILRPTSDVH